MSKEVELLKEELAKKDIRIKELEQELESDCCADNCQEVTILQAKIDELEEYKRLHDGESQARFECVCENATLQHRHQSLMKALDDGEIDKILKEYDTCSYITAKYWGYNGWKTQEIKLSTYLNPDVRIMLAKAIVNHFKSKLTGGGE